MKLNRRPILEVINLTLRRSKNFRLSVPDLTLIPGNVICLTGANGSGKTTLVESIVGVLVPDKGRVKLKRNLLTPDSFHLKRSLGFIPDDDNWIIGELTAREYFALLISIYKRLGIRHDMEIYSYQLAAKLMFTNFDSQLQDLSHGNKKKVQIIAGLLHKPSLLVVDELRNGLDPIAIKRAEDLLRKQSRDGVAILAATHDLWWAERFADEIIMIQNGRVALHERTKIILREAGSVEAKFLRLFRGSHA